MNIANKDARRCVENRVPFKGSHLFGEWQGKVYVVYSYGYHFPIYAYIGEGTFSWFKNKNRYSVSTSKHQSQACPLGVNLVQVTTDELKNLIAKNQ